MACHCDPWLGSLTSYAVAADSNGPQTNRWLEEHLLKADSQLPFSFIYGRQESGPLLKTWPRKTETRQLDSRRTEHSVIWTDPKTGLQVRVTAVDYVGTPVVEWTAYFKNGGQSDAPILDDIHPLSVSVPLSGDGVLPRFCIPKAAVVWTPHADRKSR